MSSKRQAETLRAIEALAILKVSWDSHSDYVGNFVPLVGHCIREASASAVSLPEIQAHVQATFGIRIPQGALGTILHRLARSGLLVREHGIYRPVPDALAPLDLGPVRASVLRQHAHLVQRLQSYAAKHGRSWSTPEAEKVLLAHLESLARPILEASVEGGQLVDLPSIGREGSPVVNQFVLEIAHHEPEAFEYLETVVKGSMLANVLYFPEAFSGGKPRLGRISTYLDTPVVLRITGYAPEPYRAPVLEMVALLRNQGAKLKIFGHTHREVEGVLHSAADSYTKGRAGEMPGDVVDFFTSQQMTASDVEMMIAGLDERLASFAIDIEEAPSQTEGLAVDEQALERVLDTQVGYRRREALLRDLDSLTAIHRLRRGTQKRRLEQSGAVFVTSNYALFKASRAFFGPLHGATTVPLTVLDSRMAAVAWLLNPVQATDLPRDQIIATSFAALNPPEPVWRSYLEEIRRLEKRGDLSDTQVNLLIISPEARLELMNATDGDVGAFTSGTVQEVLEHAQAAAAAEAVAALAEERQRRSEAEAAMASEKALARRAMDDAKGVTQAHAEHISGLARRLSRIIGWGAFAVVLAGVAAGTGFATTGIFPSGWSRAAPFLVAVVVWLAVIVSVCSIAFGFSLRKIVDGAERVLHKRLETRLVRLLAPPPRRPDS